MSRPAEERDFERRKEPGVLGDDHTARSDRTAALDRAVEGLSAAAEILLSVGLDTEAGEVSGLTQRLGGRTRATDNVFRRDGDYRLIMYDSDVFRLRETVGLGYMATLLAHPGREIHALQLVGSDVQLASDAGPVVDAEARRAYRQRIAELTSELVDAERAGDTSRAAQCEQELESLRAELSSAAGLAGRDRPSGSTSERARQAATKALKSALARITAHSPALGRHLASTIRTGTYCRYEPDPRLPITWRF
jgi:hypothetical protein